MLEESAKGAALEPFLEICYFARMTSVEACFQSAKTSVSVFEPAAQPIYRLRGADVTRYLHGRVTQDIKSLRPGSGARSLVLTPQGRILGHFQILCESGGYLLVVDPLSTPAAQDDFVHALLQFKVADDVVLTPEAELQILSIIGPEAERLLEALTSVVLPTGQLSHETVQAAGAAVVCVRHQRGAFAGFDIICSKHHASEVLSEIRRLKPEVSVGDAEAFEAIRIAAGIPRMEADLSEQVLAPDIDLTELASFQKGCYAGQEVVEMATARGRPNRKLVLLRGSAAEPLPEKLELYSDEQLCGAVTSSFCLPSKQEVYALAFLKTALADRTEYRTQSGIRLIPSPQDL